jgi:hypothetical protein
MVASAATGAMLRRALAYYRTNPFLQPLCAALLAGIVGALAVRYQLSSSLRLVAVCPCMILVPGPHVLNSMMDLSVAANRSGRVQARLCRSRDSGDLIRTAGGTWPSGRVPAGGSAWKSGATLARRDRCRRRCSGIQRVLLNAAPHVGMAGRRRHGGSRAQMVDSFGRGGTATGRSSPAWRSG